MSADVAALSIEELEKLAEPVLAKTARDELARRQKEAQEQAAELQAAQDQARAEFEEASAETKAYREKLIEAIADFIGVVDGAVAVHERRTATRQAAEKLGVTVAATTDEEMQAYRAAMQEWKTTWRGPKPPVPGAPFALEHGEVIDRLRRALDAIARRL